MASNCVYKAGIPIDNVLVPITPIDAYSSIKDTFLNLNPRVVNQNILEHKDHV